VPQVRRENRKGHASCVSEEVCANSVISKIKNLKKLLTRPASLEMAGNADDTPRSFGRWFPLYRLWDSSSPR